MSSSQPFNTVLPCCGWWHRNSGDCCKDGMTSIALYLINKTGSKLGYKVTMAVPTQSSLPKWINTKSGESEWRMQRGRDDPETQQGTRCLVMLHVLLWSHLHIESLVTVHIVVGGVTLVPATQLVPQPLACGRQRGGRHPSAHSRHGRLVQRQHLRLLAGLVSHRGQHHCLHKHTHTHTHWPAFDKTPILVVMIGTKALPALHHSIRMPQTKTHRCWEKTGTHWSPGLQTAGEWESGHFVTQVSSIITYINQPNLHLSSLFLSNNC